MGMRCHRLQDKMINFMPQMSLAISHLSRHRLQPPATQQSAGKTLEDEKTHGTCENIGNAKNMGNANNSFRKHGKCEKPKNIREPAISAAEGEDSELSQHNVIANSFAVLAREGMLELWHPRKHMRCHTKQRKTDDEPLASDAGGSVSCPSPTSS